MSLENSIINGIYTSYVFVLYFKYIKTRSLFFIKHDITIFILELKKKILTFMSQNQNNIVLSISNL